MYNKPSALDWSGLAAISDLEDRNWKNTYSVLESHQDEFLSKQDLFRSKEYKWPKDALRNWSRIWEYPYVYNHIRAWITRNSLAMPHVVDFGSGVTFFPFSLADLGCWVTCTDIDPIGEIDISRAAKHLALGGARVQFRLATQDSLPFKDGEADLVYSVSVIEHIPDFEKSITEIARILKPGGLFVLTVDIDLRGDMALSIEERKRLLAALTEAFDVSSPARVIHPRDILTSTSTSGLFPLPEPQGARRVWFDVKQQIIKPILGRNPVPPSNYFLAVEGFVLKKR